MGLLRSGSPEISAAVFQRTEAVNGKQRDGEGKMDKPYRRYINAVLLALLCMLVNGAGAELKLHFMDVGQGDAILVQCGDMNMLVDAGPLEAGAVVHDYIYNKQQVTRLDYVIATHEHDDHLFGMPDALSGLEVKKVYYGGAIPMSYWFSNVLPRIKGDEFAVSKPSANESFQLGDAVVTILPPMENALNANDASLAVRIDYGENCVLLTADLEGEGESHLLSSQANLKADILKVGHHGGDTSTGEQFLKAVNPRIAVISVGTGNKHGHPHKEVVNRLEKNHVVIYRTDWFGTIVLTSDGKEWTVEVSKAR